MKSVDPIMKVDSLDIENHYKSIVDSWPCIPSRSYFIGIDDPRQYCIYVLSDKGYPVYVGMSKNVYTRIRTHIGAKEKIFDRYWISGPMSRSTCSAVERMLISKYRCKYNGHVSGSQRKNFNFNAYADQLQEDLDYL